MSASAIDRSVETLRAATETAAAKSRTNSTLFQDHLTQAHAETNDRAAVMESAKIERARRKAQLTDDAPLADASDRSRSAATAKHVHHRRAKTASDDQINSPTDETAADTATSAVIAVGQTDQLALLLPLSNATPSAADRTAAGAPAAATAIPGGNTAADAEQAPQTTDKLTANATKGAAAEADPALATEPQPASQTQPADTGKLFTFVRPGSSGSGADPKATVALSAKGGAQGPDDFKQSQSTSAAATQPIKVAVQPKTPIAPVQPAPDNAIAAQQEASTELAEAVAQASSAPAPAADQPVTASGGTGSDAPNGQSTLGAVGLTASSETGHKGQPGGDGKDNSLSDGSPGSAPNAQGAAATGNSGSTGFAALVANPGNSALAAAQVASTSATRDARAPQVPPPPVEQLAFGLSRLASGANSFSMQLDPERLGSVSVQLEVDAKGKAKATFSAERPETLALMRQDSHQLLKALQDAGVKTDQGSLNFSLKDQPSAGSQDRRPSFGGSGSSRTNNFPSSNPVLVGGDASPPVDSSRLYDLHA